MIRVFFGVPESYRNTYWALLGHTGKKKKGLKGGRTPPLALVRIGLGKGGAPFLPSPSLFPFLLSYSPYMEGFLVGLGKGESYSRGVPVTSRCSGICPNSPGTILMSKYSRPIYQSLCLDHFETPRHVLDHIRDSEQPSVHENTKTLITIVTEL